MKCLFIREMMCFFYFFCHNLGEALKLQQWTTFIGFLSLSNAQVIIQYGMSECNVVFGCQLIDIDEIDVPIGYPLPSVQCLLIDEQDQIISNKDNPSEIGQIYIGGEESSFSIIP